MAIKCALVIPDTHRPFHHVKAYNLMLEVALDLKPDEVVILGDYADFYSVSSHGKHPTVVGLLQDEVEDVILGLDEIDRLFPDAKKVFLEGNHEFRLERYLCERAPALFGVTEINTLFGINRRPKWHLVGYNPNQSYKILGSRLRARHEPIGQNARTTITKSICSVVFGHIHRSESVKLTGLDGRKHISFCPGWLGDKRKPHIFNYVKGHHQWDLGFAYVLVDTETDLFYPYSVDIMEHGNNLSCIVNGKVYRS